MRAFPLLVALALVAGCTGAEEERPLASAVSQLAGPSEEELARTPGVLQGIVHTPALVPIFGARVTEERLGLAATSDAAGFFRLEGLVTGAHLLTVAAEGHLTRSITVNTRNGTTLEVNVSLQPAPPSEGYVETRELQGFLGCAALVAGRSHDCASADANHRDIFEFELADDAKLAVLELSWDASATPAAPRMTLFAETVGYGAQDLDLGNATGSGYARIVVPQAVMEKYYPEGGLMRATVSLAEGDAPAALAVQAKFVVYVSVFYHQPGDEAFSIIRSA
ncbi:MAG TPA: carboxypeptidase regulatory-like domain-containing protein [Candidatus Thermoplasmatota archaeon]|nr:carboxypeptidase regulatory-like domain-containing protein [Candidatus Thermoplasmatota archaeon]